MFILAVAGHRRELEGSCPSHESHKHLLSLWCASEKDPRDSCPGSSQSSGGHVTNPTTGTYGVNSPILQMGNQGQRDECCGFLFWALVSHTQTQNLSQIC